jgi:hypothetical protein
MSLYNLLHGTNQIAPLLLFFLGIDQDDGLWRSGRFRDIYLNEDGSRIILYTRNGGGNREHWDDVAGQESGESCRCTGCTITYHLPKHPNYIADRDDDFDSTYAYVEFSVPDKYRDLIPLLVTGEKPETIHEKFEKIMEEMKAMSKEELLENKRFAPIIKIFEAMEEKK